jgi:multimeric flavodoxin WrbA
MRAVILNGARHGEISGERAQEVLGEELSGRAWSVDAWLLREFDIEPCRGCFECWVRTPGLCNRSEIANRIASTVIRSDLTILLTRITFGGYSSELKRAVDHLIPLVSPMFMRVHGEVHHRPRYPRYPALLAVGLSRTADPEAEEVFTKLLARNALNFHSPAHAAWVVSEDDPGPGIRRRLSAFLRPMGARP